MMGMDGMGYGMGMGWNNWGWDGGWVRDSAHVLHCFARFNIFNYHVSVLCRNFGR